MRANCKAIKTSIDMYVGAVKGHADALAELPSETELPPVEIVDARPDRVAAAREFAHALLAVVVRKPEPELASGLDRLIAAGLLFRQGLPPYATYLFKHALT
jgi:hypothetical protein